MQSLAAFMVFSLPVSFQNLMMGLGVDFFGFILFGIFKDFHSVGLCLGKFGIFAAIIC